MGTLLTKLRARLDLLPERQERVLLGVAVGLFLCLYSPINYLAGSWPAGSAETPLDRAIPFVPQWVFIYALLYLLLPLPLVLPSTRPVYRRICAAFVLTSAVSFVVFLLFPLHMDLRPMDLDGGVFAEWMLKVIHQVDTPANCLPSLHVSLSLLAALSAWTLDRRVGRIAIPLAIVVAFSTLFVKQHWAWDVISGWALGLFSWALLVRDPNNARLATGRRGVQWLLAGQALLFLGAWGVFALDLLPF